MIHSMPLFLQFGGLNAYESAKDAGLPEPEIENDDVNDDVETPTEQVAAAG